MLLCDSHLYNFVLPEHSYHKRYGYFNKCCTFISESKHLQVTMVTKLLLLVGLISMVTSEEYTWMSNALFGSSLELSCNDSRVMIQADDKISWKTPDGKVVTDAYNHSDYKVKGGQGEILLIESITFANMGIYTCILTKSSDGMARAYLLRGVNLDGPQFANLNEKYEENITVAVIASLVFAVPLVGLMALEKFRYEKRNEDKTGQAYIVHPERKTPPQVVVTAYDNPACDNQVDDFSTQL
ncbi:unnamed protein product [Mytilus coruscus]|uniref:Ig-like domain-containing protein n=1 Tax=Mytilus coruscus TaxID=42192 RepID=A0A6J8EQK3_MYTCO|nr:unnamed protein product [Mytilus coruscus]